jgi:trimethylamine---corrinoid protein Co-methyltransferase
MNTNHPSSERNPRRRTRTSQRTEAIYPPFLKRNIPLYELLTVDGVEAIEHHADLILQEFGIQFRGDAETIRLFVEAGAEAQDEIVRFPLTRANSKTNFNYTPRIYPPCPQSVTFDSSGWR